jgi:hypothetical protein
MSTYAKKANQVFREQKHTSPFSRRVSSFAEAFPTIDILQVTVKETNFATTLEDNFTSETNTYDKNNISEYHDCNCLECHNGGIAVCDILRRMVSSNITEETVTKHCQGSGKKSYGTCSHSFEMTAKITYKKREE